MVTGWSKVTKNGTWIIGAVFAASVMTTQPTFAQDNTQECGERELVKAGTLKLTVKSVGLIVGARWGTGVVTLNDGKSFSISLKGAKIMEIGAAKLEMEGSVYNLDKIEDFPGTYLGIGGGLAVPTAALGGTSITNGKCVVLNASPVGSEGLRVSMPIAPGGVSIKIEE